MEDDLSALIVKMQTDMAPPILESLKKRWPKEKRRQHTELTAFRKRLRTRWSRGLNKLGMLILMSRDFGNEINQEARATQTVQNGDLVDVMTRLHARTCQVAEEVLVLLESGFANGAMARRS